MTEGTTEVSAGLHDVCVTTASDISMHIESIFLQQKCVTDIFVASRSKMLLNKLVFIRSLPIHMSQSCCNLHC